MTQPAIAVVILAGGQASRLPGKLELDMGGMPLLLRVYRNVRAAGPVYVSANCAFPREIDVALECPVVVDRWHGRGPLAAIYSTFGCISQRLSYVVAADAPFLTAAVLRQLADAWEPECEAVVPVNAAGRLEPLCALYDRVAFLGAAHQVLREGSGGVAAAVERLRAKRIRFPDERVFANVNTAADYRALVH